jgi:hypothetical protein
VRYTASAGSLLGPDAPFGWWGPLSVQQAERLQSFARTEVTLSGLVARVRVRVCLWEQMTKEERAAWTHFRLSVMLEKLHINGMELPPRPEEWRD